jgi:hypothetical protein
VSVRVSRVPAPSARNSMRSRSVPQVNSMTSGGSPACGRR